MPYPTENNSNLVSSPQDFEVRTMPKKFLSMRPDIKSKINKTGKRQKLNFKKNIIMGLVIILVIGLLMLLAAWLFMRSFKNSTHSSLNPPAVSNSQPDKSVSHAENDKQKNNSSNFDSNKQKKDDILNLTKWISYTDKDYYYSFKYPPKWTFNQSTSSKNGSVKQFNLFNENKQLLITLNIFDNSKGLTLEDWLTSYKINLSDLNNYTLAGQIGYKLNKKIDSSFDIFIIYASNVYQLSFYQVNDKILGQLYNLFLANFKFLESKSNSLFKSKQNKLIIKSAQDSDGDGLTDVEESIYKTNKDQADTDGDSYPDGEEVTNLYDPLLAGDDKLVNSKTISVYTNSTYHYSVFYPVAWQLKGRDDAIIFQAEDGEFIQISVYNNDSDYIDIYQWYRQNIKADINDLVKMEVAGVPAIRTQNGYNVYFMVNNKIYNLVYNIGLRQTSNFMTTFNMLIKSFHLISTK